MTFPTDPHPLADEAALRRQLLALARRWLGHAHEAEDLVQEAYLRTAQGRLPASPAAREAWLVTVLHHLCIDLQRRQGRYRTLLAHAAQEQAQRQATDQDGPAQRAVQAQHVERALVHVVRTLAAGDAATVLLYTVFDLGHAELAALSGRSESASRQHLRRLLQRLRSPSPGTDGHAWTPQRDEDACLLALCRYALVRHDPAGLVATLRASRPQTMLASALASPGALTATAPSAPAYVQPIRQQNQLGLLIRNDDGVLTWLPLCELAEDPCMA